MNITIDKRGGHWPARASQKFGGGKPKYKSPNREKKSPPNREKDFSSEEKSPPPQHGKILYDFLGRASAYSCPPCGRPNSKKAPHHGCPQGGGG